MNSEEKKICLNCGNEFSSRYCPSCGQEASTKRFSLKETLKGLYLVFFVAENTFYRTAGNLFYRPGYMIREYLIGERVKYLKPIKMLVCLVTVYILVTNFIFPIDAGESTNTTKIAVESSTPQLIADVIRNVNKFLENRVVHSLVSACLFALPFTWIFRKCKITFKDGTIESLNIAEQFYTLVYLSCQDMIISFLLIPARMIFGFQSLQILTIVLIIGLRTWCYKQLLSISWLSSFVKVIIAGTITIFAVIALIMIGCIIFYTFNLDLITSTN